MSPNGRVGRPNVRFVAFYPSLSPNLSLIPWSIYRSQVALLIATAVSRDRRKHYNWRTHQAVRFYSSRETSPNT
jgi:hypothetical protein